MKNVVILTGAGISAESGISTFRDSDGLWEQYRVEDVATYEAYLRNPELVINFYNERRKGAFLAEPNEAHRQLVRLEEKYNVQIITQNIDNLHERAGSTNVLHLHGILTQGRSDRDPNLIVEIGDKDIHIGDKAPDGAQLRPHIVLVWRSSTEHRACLRDVSECRLFHRYWNLHERVSRCRSNTQCSQIHSLFPG